MLGAAVGCLGVLVLLNNTDGPSAILWVGAFAAAGALFFSTSGIGSMPQTEPPLDFFLRHRGLLCFNNLAVAAVTEIDRNYPQHMRGARELAQEYLSSEKRLPAMLSACGW